MYRDRYSLMSMQRRYPEIGTRIIFPNVGSYSVVFKPPFIQTDIPVYLWNNSELKLVRRAQLASDITSLDII